MICEPESLNKTYNKILIARKSEENNCFANEGEWLIIADTNLTKTIKLPEEHYFFMGIETLNPSRYGWVYKLESPITFSDFISKLQIPINDEIVEKCKLLLEAVRKEKSGTPMVCDFMSVGILEKKEIQRVHKVFFY